MKAIQVRQPGGPEQMELVDVPTPEPGPQQALVRIEASGINFIDVYFRTGLYKADLPLTPGMEGAGVVEAVGPDVNEVAGGGRGAHALAGGAPLGGGGGPGGGGLEVPGPQALEPSGG